MLDWVDTLASPITGWALGPMHSAVLPIAAMDKVTILEQLDPETRARLFSVFVGLVVVGIALMTFAWLGARIVRRYAGMTLSESSRSKPTSADDDWWQKPLVPPGDEEPLE